MSTKFIIFSVDRPKVDIRILRYAHRDVLEAFAGVGISIKELDGRYHGQSERSFVVPYSSLAEELVKGFCTEYTQDCYLTVDSRNSAWFVYPDDSTKYVGQWRETSRYIAHHIGLDSYTFDPFTRKYYTIDTSRFLPKSPV